MERALASGRKLVLVTGRHLPELKSIFPRLELFQCVVVENGALLYRPETDEESLLCEPPPERLLTELRNQEVPFQLGRGIVATWEQYREIVVNAIHRLGLDLQTILNKGAVMVLPSGVDKASGLKAALGEIGVRPENVIGFGDGENDLAFLEICGLSVAVGNALPALKAQVDIVTKRTHGAGVAEVIEQLLQGDLETCEARVANKKI